MLGLPIVSILKPTRLSTGPGTKTPATIMQIDRSSTRGFILAVARVAVWLVLLFGSFSAKAAAVPMCSANGESAIAPPVQYPLQPGEIRVDPRCDNPFTDTSSLSRSHDQRAPLTVFFDSSPPAVEPLPLTWPSLFYQCLALSADCWTAPGAGIRIGVFRPPESVGS